MTNSIELQGVPFEEALAFLAQCQAEYGKLAKICSTKEPDSLRRACDDELRLRYELQGVKSIDVKLHGSVVGTYSVVKTTERPEQKVKKLTISEGNAIKWLMEDAPEEYYDMLCLEAVKIAEDYMLLTGEIIPSAQYVEEIVPAEPSRFKNTVLRVDSAKVEAALEASKAVEAEKLEESSE